MIMTQGLRTSLVFALCGLVSAFVGGAFLSLQVQHAMSGVLDLRRMLVGVVFGIALATAFCLSGKCSIKIWVAAVLSAASGWMLALYTAEQLAFEVQFWAFAMAAAWSTGLQMAIGGFISGAVGAFTIWVVLALSDTALRKWRAPWAMAGTGALMGLTAYFLGDQKPGDEATSALALLVPWQAAVAAMIGSQVSKPN